MRLGFEGGAGAVAARCSRRATPASSRCPGAAPSRRRRTTTPTSGSSGRRTTGSTGWPRGQFPDHPWRSYLQRSALTLKGLTLRADRRDRRGGDDLAAGDAGRRPQLRLPVHLDPRRDVRAVGDVLPRLRLGGRRLLLLHRRRRRAATTTCRSCTASAASATSPSTSSTTCPGTPSSRPVRIGNAAYAQQQHDVWGALLDSVYLHTKAADHLDNRIWPILDTQVGEALKHWREPDAGIWEVRGEPSTSPPRRSCAGWRSTAAPGWPGCGEDGEGRRVGRRRPRRSRPTSWRTASTSAGCSPSTTAATALDASLLLAPLVRFLPPDDPRIRATVLAIARRADRRRAGAALPGRGDRRRLRRRGGHLHDLLVLAGLGAGRDRRVRPRPAALREAAVGFASPLELYAEEIDPHSGRHLGNFPQAFTHLALINAVMHVIRLDEAAGIGGEVGRRSGS